MGALLRPLPGRRQRTFSRFAVFVSVHRGTFRNGRAVACSKQRARKNGSSGWSHGRKPSIGESLLQIRRLLWLLESLRQHAQGVLCHFLLPQFQQEGFYIRGGQRSRSSFQSCIRGVSFLVKFLCSPSIPLVNSCRGLPTVSAGR